MSIHLPLRSLRRPLRRACLGAAVVTLTFMTFPAEAQAQSFVERLVFRGELGAGTMLSEHQRTTLEYGLTVQGSGRLGFTLFGPVALQASFSSWWFPAERAAGTDADGQQYSVTGGLRLEPMLGSAGRLFVDGNVGLGITGAQNRVTVDVGLGYEFSLTRGVGLGPVVRYGHLFSEAGGQDFPSDAQYWSGGLSLSLRVVRPPPTPLDADGDGVFDDDDACPTEAAGARPDPEQRGCPTRERDRDGDRVMDAQDLCPDVPQGATPDTRRVGCPAVDSDRDGVFDAQDLCATTPQGDHPDPARLGCPDGDDDADGVFNHTDQCPQEAMGLQPDAARAGCPLADRDRDTVPDATDACPDVVGAPDINPRRNGCPGLVVVRDGMIVILQPVFFATNRDRILPPSVRVLTAVVSALRAQPVIRRIGIEGHTDNVGGDEANLSLSQRRAQAVATWLIQHGIDAARVEARGFGASRPIVPNDVASGRAANRRVEFHILDPQQRPSVDANGSATRPAPAAGP
jgi:outer membrane protein OmpA-like peptidoglycan-associated protein